MSFLGYFTDAELRQKLVTNKVDISIAIHKVFPFLHGLRDKLLITKEKFDEISNKGKQDCSKAVYSLLEWLEDSGSSTIRKFWCNLFQDYNLQEYPKLYPLQASLIEDLGEDRGKYEPATVPVVKTGLSIKTGLSVKRKKHPDEECAHHSASGRTQKNSRDQSLECSKDPSRKECVNWQLMKKEDDKPNVRKTRKLPSLPDKVDFDSNELPVSCGGITGILDKKRLALGSKTACIKSETVWYTPSQFEAKGGRGKSKNWKLSIRCKGYQLSKLIEWKYLLCQSPSKTRTVKAVCTKLKKRKTLIESNSSDESSFSESELESDMEEHVGLMKKFAIQHEDGSSNEHRKGTEAEDTEGKDDFFSNELPVTCGSMTGVLHKCRFITGINGKCIRTETKWLTPSEFEKMSDVRKDIRYWKRNIRCKSETLGKLIQRGYLKLHKPDCLCEKCTSPDFDSQENDDECTVCDDGGDLICCDECPRAYHYLCHVPSLSPNLSESLVCTFCKMDKLSANKTRANVSNSEFGVYQSTMTPKYILKCEYILLHLSCKTECVVFDKNPCDIVAGYADIIEDPMWLCRVKEKLAKNEYQNVGGFIDDMRLIFHNCARFNQDNEFEAIGRKLSDEFEEVMMQVFDISNNLYIPQMDD
ncbi:nuclear body protein SP140-like protein isoform X2 [Carcharodon carcharias]|uniref:nuclear body protein SP140-like protein isoform X2 n=1 Tax=Carcharodon carcharias TaxID=13397 RepID=UPI001B7DAE6E|nr:nuclear body protein SP140-like protein isoform X2 [Carcharodon carcharias]